MGAYEKWKRMVFEVVKKNFVEMGRFSLSKHNEDFYCCDDFDYPYRGIIAYDVSSYKKFFEKSMCFPYISGYYSSTFRTNYIWAEQYDEKFEKEGEYDLYLCLWTQKSSRKFDYFSITTEGISCTSLEKKKKFILFDGGVEQKTAFSTFRELAVDGYEVGNGSITLSTKIDESVGGMYYCSKHIDSYHFSGDLKRFLSEMVDLYKNNEELYDDALDEITEKYPHKPRSFWARILSVS